MILYSLIVTLIKVKWPNTQHFSIWQYENYWRYFTLFPNVMHKYILENSWKWNQKITITVQSSLSVWRPLHIDGFQNCVLCKIMHGLKFILAPKSTYLLFPFSTNLLYAYTLPQDPKAVLHNKVVWEAVHKMKGYSLWRGSLWIHELIDTTWKHELKCPWYLESTTSIALIGKVLYTRISFSSCWNPAWKLLVSSFEAEGNLISCDKISPSENQVYFTLYSESVLV